MQKLLYPLLNSTCLQKITLFLPALCERGLGPQKERHNSPLRAPFSPSPVSAPGSQVPRWERVQDVAHPFSHPFCQTCFSVLSSSHFQCLFPSDVFCLDFKSIDRQQVTVYALKYGLHKNKKVTVKPGF